MGKKETITVDPSSLIFTTGRSWKGVYKGWMVYANGLKAMSIKNSNFNDDEIVSVIFDCPLEKNIVRPKIKGRECLLLSQIEKAEEIDKEKILNKPKEHTLQAAVAAEVVTSETPAK